MPENSKTAWCYSKGGLQGDGHLRLLVTVELRDYTIGNIDKRVWFNGRTSASQAYDVPITLAKPSFRIYH